MTVPTDSAFEWLERESAKLRAARAATPGRSVLFPDLGDAGMRRQIVRWMGSEYDGPTPGILETLRSALADRDWEVRATAMLVAARLHAVTLRSAVRDTDLPSAGQSGLDDIDVQLLIGIRFVTAELLGASLDRNEAEEIVAADFPMLRYDLSALVRRDAALPRTQRQLLIHALVTPAALLDELPDALPHGIEMRDGIAWLTGTGVEMLWVGPETFILGGDVTPGSATAEVREHILRSGFFISRRPLLPSDVASHGIETTAEADLSPDVRERCSLMPDPPLMLDFTGASSICDTLSCAAASTITLPTTDELECAARGTDGRRFPWGNGMQRLNGREQSPTGLERFAAPAAQWTSSVEESGAPCTAGGPSSPSCAGRTHADPDTFAALRVVVRGN